MSKRKRGLYFIIALVIAIVTTGGVLTLLAASYTNQTPQGLHNPIVKINAEQQETVAAESVDPQPLGEPCGSGELLPDWVLCIYGTIAEVDSQGTILPLDDVQITISYGDKQISGTTFIHPGEDTPTYGIDISSLAPDFLQAVTLTAVLPHTSIQQQLILFPDFNTQSQQVDIYIPAVSALDPAPVWGHVIDFASGGAVADAIIIAEYNGQTVTVTTSLGEDAEPTYSLYNTDLAAINAFAGDTITLTAQFGDDIDQQIIQIGYEPVQIDFVTGWKCDDFDPLPRESGGVGLPRESGGVGLPDVACFWGVGLVDGVPQSGVSVQFVISDTVYEGETHNFPGEDIPRYAIGVWGGTEIEGEVVTVTAVYSGLLSTQTITTTLDPSYHQRIDTSISSTTSLGNYLNINFIWAMTWQDEYLWAGTNGGLVRWNVVDNTYTHYTSLNGLASNTVSSIAYDHQDSLWIGTSDHGVSRFNFVTNKWATFNSENSGLANDDVQDIAVEDNGNVWFATRNGISRFIPSTNSWKTFDDILFDGELFDDALVTAVTLDQQGGIWFGTFAEGAKYYNIQADEWTSFSTSNSGLPVNKIKDIAIDHNGNLWFSTTAGLGYYQPSTDSWETFTSSNSGLTHNNISSIVVDNNDNSLWISTQYDELNHFNPQTRAWQTYSSTIPRIQNIYSLHKQAILPGTDNSLWIGTAEGIARYQPATDSWSVIRSTDNGPIYNQIVDIAIDSNNNVFAGHTGSGLSFYSASQDSWQYFNTSNSPLPNERITKVVIQNNFTWIGTGGGTVRYDPALDDWQIYTYYNSEILSNRATDILVDQNDDLWFSHSSGISYFQPETNSWQTFTPDNSDLQIPIDEGLTALAVDRRGIIWIGGTSGLLDTYNPETDEWTIFNLYADTPFSQLTDIRAIAVDKNDNIWIVADDGIYYLDRSYDEWTTYTIDNSGLPTSAYSIAFDKNDDLWFGLYSGTTADGVAHYQPQTNTWRTYSELELGLGDYNIQAIESDQFGDIWFGGGGVAKWYIEDYQSELALQLDGATLQVPAGTITYTATAVNQGQTDAPTTLTITLPADLTILNSNPPVGNTSPLVWDLGTLAADGSQQTVTITAVLPPDAIPGTTYTAVATATTTVPEEYLSNNSAQLNTLVLDPYRADVRVSLAGPPLLVPGNTAVYDIWLDNIGGLDAANTQLDLILPPELSLQTVYTEPAEVAVPTPTLANPPIWDIGTLNAFTPPLHFIITTTVAANLPIGTELSVTAVITTSTTESDPTNNSAVATIPTTLTDARTLILIAPSRLTERFGASPVLDRLYEVAAHPLVNGVVLDVMRDNDVAAAYAAWDSNLGSWQAANNVASSIKALIDDYTIAYPNLRYLLIVGGDDIIPFYRVADQNGTSWQERGYASYIPPGSVQAAFAANKLLTDDFYADRSPTIPDSPFWLDEHPLYLPDFAIGRLIETPTEIIAAINAFLANDGTITLDSNLVGALPTLTNDLGDAQCALFQQDNMSTTCSTSQPFFATEALSTPYDGLWSAPHANHLSIGNLTATDIANSSLDYSQSLLISIGCHAGLNVNEAANSFLPSLDVAQAFMGKGGTYIASSAYTYASYLSTGYSEALALSLTEQLLKGSQQSLGLALIRAKQTYFSSRSDWFDYTDEKVVLPMTLYGFPMLQIITPDSMLDSQPDPLAEMATITAVSTETAVSSNGQTAVSYTFDPLQSTFNSTTEGNYFDFQGETLAQEGTPIQPTFQSPIPHTLDDQTVRGQTVRGIILRSATYDSYNSFDPVIAQSWAIEVGAAAKLTERDLLIEGWDRPLPFELGQFNGLNHNISNINLALGRYNSYTQQEMIFNSFQFDIIYSDSSDITPPTLLSTGSITAPNPILIVKATDNNTVDAVTVICDDGQGKWQTATLQQQENSWVGNCNSGSSPIAVQLVDVAGNVTQSLWQSGQSGQSGQSIFLPLIMHNPK